MTYDVDSEGFPDDSENQKLTLHFFWLLDRSYSMDGRRISELNTAIREVLPDIQKVADSNPSVNVLMRAIKFSNSVDWHIGPDPVSLADFSWVDLDASGGTATASAINFLCDELEPAKLKNRCAPPVCILISDGYCTESEDSYDRAIEKLNNSKVGRRAVRMSIAVGQEGEYNEDQLTMFGNQDANILKARTPEELVGYIRWAAMSSVVWASTPVGEAKNCGIDNAPQFKDPDEVDLF